MLSFAQNKQLPLGRQWWAGSGKEAAPGGSRHIMWLRGFHEPRVKRLVFWEEAPHLPRASAAKTVTFRVFLESALQVFLLRFTNLPRTWNENRMERTRLFASEQSWILRNEPTDHTCSNVSPNFISAYIECVATQVPLKGTRPVSSKSSNNIIILLGKIIYMLEM